MDQNKIIDSINEKAFESPNRMPDDGQFPIEFQEGISLSLSESDQINTENPTQVVVLAGESESGKTTLLACIYELFSEGKFHKFLFAGSLTLPGFEKRCHLARIASERVEADTERTKAKDNVEFLHLIIAEKSSPSTHINLLFTDISGEKFRMIKDSTEECKKYQFFSRADHIVYLIDGAQLISPKTRHKAYSDCRSLLRSVLDNNLINKSTLVDIVFSKWDLIEPQKTNNANSEFASYIEQNIIKEFSFYLDNLSFYKIAARPKSNKHFSFGYNLENLLIILVNKKKTIDNSIQKSIDLRSLNQIDKFIAN